MSATRFERRPPLALLVAAGLLVCGLVIDAALARPRLQELRRLSARRTEALAQLTQSIEREREARQAAQLLGVEELADLTARYPRGDVLGYIAQALDRARVERLELAGRASAADGRLQRTELVVRVRGSYARILQLVNDLERGPRLVKIGTLIIEPDPESAALQAQLGLSVYDLVGEP
jgi:hypothetical protein